MVYVLTKSRILKRGSQVKLIQVKYMIKKSLVAGSSLPSDVKYGFYTYHISNLEGKMLTLIEASIQDVEQRRALKDIVRQTVWNWAIENNIDRDCEENKVK